MYDEMSIISVIPRHGTRDPRHESRADEQFEYQSGVIFVVCSLGFSLVSSSSFLYKIVAVPPGRNCLDF